jgi:hypothetical protein
VDDNGVVLSGERYTHVSGDGIRTLPGLRSRHLVKRE